MKNTQKAFLRDLSSKNKNVTMESARHVLNALKRVLFDYVKQAETAHTNIEVVIPGLGKFYTVLYNKRRRFNPNTRRIEYAPPSTKLRFKASESLYKDNTK